MFFLGVAAAVGTPVAVTFASGGLNGKDVVGSFSQAEFFDMGMKGLLVLAVISAFMVRRHAIFMFGVIAVLTIASETAADRTDTRESWRSFFGVLKKSETIVPNIGGRVKMLAHGTTLHGGQAQDPNYRCTPMVYYTPSTPIGQVFIAEQKAKASVRIGAVGLGTGTVAAYTRPGDHLTFYEIDPLVVRIANDPKHFTYTTECAKGRVDFVVGDARLTVAKEPDGLFDILLIDAFSSDAVPAHLLTVEAVRGYLAKLRPTPWRARLAVGLRNNTTSRRRSIRLAPGSRQRTPSSWCGIAPCWSDISPAANGPEEIRSRRDPGRTTIQISPARFTRT
jgi:hypothetical protein